jgi:hypothetical protein
MTRKKADQLASLHKLLAFYDTQIDWVSGGGRTVPVLFSARVLDKFAVREAPDVERWKYRGYTLVRSAGAP